MSPKNKEIDSLEEKDILEIVATKYKKRSKKTYKKPYKKHTKNLRKTYKNTYKIFSETPTKN